MSDEQEEKCPDCPAGIPAWVMTFADLMSLLMCFFVLLLAFSEMDALKYKQVAGSMREAFGVQNKIKVKDIPKGTSIIAKEFSPGRPEPTPFEVIRQNTTDFTRSTLKVYCDAGESQSEAEKKAAEVMQKLIKSTQEDARKIAEAVKKEIRAGKVDVETRGRRIVVRVKEQSSFQSGSDVIQRGFVPIMTKLRKVLKDTPGELSIEGHTDDLPIETNRFRSNWDLSSARAVSVAHALFRNGQMNEKRFKVAGYADTVPLVPNDSAQNRARNRRVEIVIEQGLDVLPEEVSAEGKAAVPAAGAGQPQGKAPELARQAGEASSRRARLEPKAPAGGRPRPVIALDEIAGDRDAPVREAPAPGRVAAPTTGFSDEFSIESAQESQDEIF